MTLRKSLTLLALIGVGFAPLLLAMWMYGSGTAIPAGRTNHGELILPPWPLAALGIVDKRLNAHGDSPRPWRLLLFGGDSCNAGCQETLHTVRQVNIALGRDADRIERFYLPPQSWTPKAGFSQLLQEEYPRLRVEPIAYELLQDHLQREGIGFPERGLLILLADPHGNIMMRYGPEHSGKQLLEDLKRLLKVSKIG